MEITVHMFNMHTYILRAFANIFRKQIAKLMLLLLSHFEIIQPKTECFHLHETQYRSTSVWCHAKCELIEVALRELFLSAVVSEKEGEVAMWCVIEVGYVVCGVGGEIDGGAERCAEV